MTTEEAKRIDCGWCLRKNAKQSDWEQMSVTKGWLRLCNRCARVRLQNPYNALIEMRKVTYDH
jgi:hypothetical protein